MIRAAENKDRELWIKLNKEFMDFEVQDDDLWNDISAVSPRELGKVFDEAQDCQENIVLLMIEDEETGEVIGFANLMKIFSVWAKGFALIIDDLYINEAAQGKGYGKKTLDEIEKYARETGYKRIQFQSEETNPNAKEFYISQGYTPTDMNFYVRYL